VVICYRRMLLVATLSYWRVIFNEFRSFQVHVETLMLTNRSLVSVAAVTVARYFTQYCLSVCTNKPLYSLLIYISLVCAGSFLCCILILFTLHFFITFHSFHVYLMGVALYAGIHAHHFQCASGASDLVTVSDNSSFLLILESVKFSNVN